MMRILVVDDEPAIRFSLSELLESDGHTIQLAEHAPAALALLETESVDLIISDLTMPAMTGLQLLEEIQTRHAGTIFVLMTAHGDERTAVRALKQGAYDYMPKPFDNEEVRATIARVRELLALRQENARLRSELAGGLGELIGSTPAMIELFRIVKRVAPTDATVLITGESGTGKELLARAIHSESKRSNAPFIAVNCSALPGELIESELFGHVKGAFTGADRDREGLFEAAHGGTLFLDEIGDLAAAAQAKLLRALEARVITAVGSTRETPIDVRIIAATHRDLEAMARSAGFREDLLYRLKVVAIGLPPLRDRREDIPAIAISLIASLAQRHGRPAPSLSEPVRRALIAYDWPGNVRELRNALERAVVLAESAELELTDLPPQLADTRPLSAAESVLAELPFTEARTRALDAFDRAFLAAALERHGGNVSATARALGLHRQSLQKLLRRIEPDSPR